MDNLSVFIRTERMRFATRHNNLFAFAFSDVQRYYQFLQIILSRYKESGERFKANTAALQASLNREPGSHLMTQSQLEIQNESIELGVRLQLEVESFYLFAKILLDEIARAVEFYFGQAKLKNCSLDSHDDFTKSLAQYTTHLGITLPPNLITKAQSLKTNVSDFRDYQIAHHKSPRTLRGTTWAPDESPRILFTSIYPTPKDQQVESKHLGELLREIEDYISEVIDFIELNRDKTNLELQQPN